MLKAVKLAVHMKLKSEDAFNKFTKTFPPEAVDRWIEMVIAWDRDPKEKNPYEEPTPCGCLYNSISFIQAHRLSAVTLASVMLELANEETEDVRQGIIQPHETSPSRFIQKGLDLEEQQ